MGCLNSSKKSKNPLPDIFTLGFSIAIAWASDQYKELSDEAARRWQEIALKLKGLGLKVPYSAFGKIAASENLYTSGYRETYPIRNEIFEYYGAKASSAFEMGLFTPLVLITEGRTPAEILEHVMGFGEIIGLDIENINKHFSSGLAPIRSKGLTPPNFQAVFQKKIISVCEQICKELEVIDPNTQSEIDYKNTEEIEQEISKMYRNSLDKAKRYGGDPFSDYRQNWILPKKYEFGMNCLLDSVAYMVGGEILQMIYEEIKKDDENYSIIETPSGESVPGLPTLFAVTNLEVVTHAVQNLGIFQMGHKYYRL